MALMFSLRNGNFSPRAILSETRRASSSMRLRSLSIIQCSSLSSGGIQAPCLVLLSLPTVWTVRATPHTSARTLPLVKPFVLVSLSSPSSVCSSECAIEPLLTLLRQMRSPMCFCSHCFLHLLNRMLRVVAVSAVRKRLGPFVSWLRCSSRAPCFRRVCANIREHRGPPLRLLHVLEKLFTDPRIAFGPDNRTCLGRSLHITGKSGADRIMSLYSAH